MKFTGKPNKRLADSDWGPDSDSGKAIQSDQFPNVAKPNQPGYGIEFVDVGDDNFAMGSIPFVVDMGDRKIYLGDEGSLHAQIMAFINPVGPIARGYVDIRTGEVKLYAFNGGEDELALIEKTVLDYTGRGRSPIMSRQRDPEVCPVCDELYSECQCVSWGEGADWAEDPIDQATIREMKPGIQASKIAKQWLPDESDARKYTLGRCAAWAVAHQQEYPHLRFGMDWERLDPDDEDFGLIYDQTEDAELPEDLDEEPSPLNGYWRPQHIFTHDDKYFYDVEGAHPLSQLPHWDDYTLNHDLHDVEMTGMLEPEYAPTAEWIHQYAPAPWKMSRLASGQDVARAALSNPTVSAVNEALTRAGGEVYAVGGAIRDAVLGKEPKDIDLMVAGLPAEGVEAALRGLDGRVDYTGKDFGVFRFKSGDDEVEIALPRTERSTGAGHTDFDVQADHRLSPEEDLYRRDFTANAMAVNLNTGELIDPYNGAQDLASGTLRTINEQSLRDDPLRVARGLVARGRHGLQPDEGTRQQMQEAAAGLQNLPPERIQAELDKLLASDDPAEAIRLAQETGALEHIFPEIFHNFDYDQNNRHHDLPLGEHLLSVLRNTAARTDDPDVRLAALLHDIGKPSSAWADDETGQNHYYQKRLPDGRLVGKMHEDEGAEMAKAALERLRYPKDRIDRVTSLIANHMFAPFDSERGARKFLNKVGDEHADDLLHLRWSDTNGKSTVDPKADLEYDAQSQLINQVRESEQATDRSQLAVNGSDLINLGIPAGPQVGEVLSLLTQAVLDDPTLNEPNALLGLAQKYAPKTSNFYWLTEQQKAAAWDKPMDRLSPAEALHISS